MPITAREVLRQDRRGPQSVNREHGRPKRRAEREPPLHERCLALVDAEGTVLWGSGGLHDRLAAAGVPFAERSPCCDVLACAANTGSGGERCLTRLALADGTGLAPRRWRAPDGAVEAALSAKVVPAASGAIVVFDLGFLDVDVGDVARRPVADVDVRALGPLSVRIDGRPMDGDWLQQRAGQTFRYLLAARSGAARSEAIANALWPDRGPAAIANVRYCVYKVREQLDDGNRPSQSVILRSAGGYRLDPQRLVVDVDVFQAKVSAGLEAQRAQRFDDSDALLAEALELYRGDILADDPYADWAFTEREYLRGLAGKALGARARIALVQHRLETASACLLRLTQLEPFDSQAHQLLIGVCLRRGRRTEAVRHYSALRMRLARAFGEKPDFDLARVAADITNIGV
jgi:DNA-binding SARP family transcriptional activator